MPTLARRLNAPEMTVKGGRFGEMLAAWMNLSYGGEARDYDETRDIGFRCRRGNPCIP